VTLTRQQMASAWEIDWFDYQVEALDGELHTDSAELRSCLYFRTGAGKTYTALAMMAEAGVNDITVVAPPKTHGQWKTHAEKIGLRVETISHALYRQKGRKFSRLRPFIIDEFHMLGGHTGSGWTRLRTQAKGMQAPLVILSATPNYNDVERVYCVEHVLDPIGSKGGYIEWLYRNCITSYNAFGQTPIVEGFLDGRSARDHLAALPHVYHVDDPHADFPIADITLDTEIPDELEEYGLDRRRGRIIASRMEQVSAYRKHQLIDDDGFLRDEVYDVLAREAGNATTPVMVFCARAEIAEAAHKAALVAGARSGLVTYQPNPKHADKTLTAFKAGELDVLFGTATMSTGVDGLDKVCDMLILLDDTDDAALRRQVIGRILPRGTASNVSKKTVVRLCLGVT
jgi:superfamily II DNA or RNA helicase